MSRFSSLNKGKSPKVEGYTGPSTKELVEEADVEKQPKLSMLERASDLLRRSGSTIPATISSILDKDPTAFYAAMENLGPKSSLETLFLGKPGNKAGFVDAQEVLDKLGVENVPLLDVKLPERSAEPLKARPAPYGLTKKQAKEFTQAVEKERPALLDQGSLKIGTSDVLGLGLGIAADPLTYVTGGTGQGAKVGGKVLSKAGTKTLKGLIKQSADDIARELTEKGIQTNVDDLLKASAGMASPARKRAERTLAKMLADPKNKALVDQGGLKFAGKSLIPGEVFEKAGDVAVKTIDKLPGGKKTRQSLQTLFGSRTAGLPEKVSDLYETHLTRLGKSKDDVVEKLVKVWDRGDGVVYDANARLLVRDTLMKAEDDAKALLKARGLPDQELTRIDGILRKLESGIADDIPVEQLKQYRDELFRSSDSIKKLGIPQEEFDKLLYARIRTLPKELQEPARRLNQVLRKNQKLDVTSGLLKRTLPNYFPRRYINLDDDLMAAARGSQGSSLYKTIGGGARKRKVETLEDALELEKTRGLQLEKDPTITIANRLIRDETARETNKLYEKIRNLYDGEIPTLVDKRLKSLSTPTGFKEETRAVLETLDKATNIYKQALTRYFPSFHVRNAMTNKFFRYLGEGAEVINPKAWLDTKLIRAGKQGTVTNALGEIINYDEIRKAAEKYRVTKGYFAGELGETFAERLTPKSKLGTLKTKVDDFLNGIEQGDRLGLFTSFVKKGMDYETAAKEVNRFLFDYSNLSRFEKEVMRRAFPFYTFNRKALGLLSEQLIKQPGKFTNLVHFKDFLQDNDVTYEEFAKLPDYLKSRITIQISPNKYITGVDLGFESTLANLEDPGKFLIGQLNPLAKAPLEALFEKDYFRGRTLDEAAKNLNDLPETLLQGPLGKFIGAKRVPNPSKKYDKEAPAYKWIATKPKRLHLLRSLPTARGMGSLGSFAKDPDTLRALLDFLTGVSVTEVDPGMVKWLKDKELEASLKRKGLMKTFDKPYVPKELKSSKSDIIDLFNAPRKVSSGNTRFKNLRPRREK